VKLEERQLIDQALTSEEPCLGAVFCSYTFEPAYFEEHVLRGLLRLGGDPEEDAARYHEEARRALQETPVACLIDASVRRPGRRLPYDVHLVRRRTFHPKVFLLLFESEARLAVGSGNVTKSGIEQNTELFFLRRLRYDNAVDGALLMEVDGFLGKCQALSDVAGTQLDLVRNALANRLRGASALRPGDERDVRFVDSFGGRLVGQLDEEIHRDAKITRIGVLAPFFEQDDLAVAGQEDGLRALLGELLSLRRSTEAVLDLGVPWDDSPVAAPASATAPVLNEGAGCLWAWRRREDGDGKPVERVTYFTLIAPGAKRIQAMNANGEACRFDRDDCDRAISEGRLWPVARPVVHAPKAILARIAQEHPVGLWLHPTIELTSVGRVRRRPLHAKVVLVTAAYRGRTFTHALIGSANASRAALSRGVEQGGNVESCVLCRFDGEVTLRELLPSLVRYSIDDVELLEREAINPGIDLSAWIEDVVHDAAARTLRVTWRATGPAPLGPWELRYVERRLANGDGPPASATTLEGFELDAASAEVTLLAGGGEWAVPIRVLDLAALPTNPQLSELGLRELLALLGRRVGSERLAALRAQRGAAGIASVLDAVFGEGFGPTDVFKAWWGAVEDLKLATTVAAFRHRLGGPTGVLTAWKHLREVPDDVLSRDEVWVYGCELLREIKALELPPGADTPTKNALLGDASAALETELDQLAPSETDHSWLGTVAKFYGIGGPDVGA